MMSINATLLVSDDVSFSITGKMSMTGIYTGDLSIPVAGTILGQLVFMFFIDMDLTSLPKQISLGITLPGGESSKVDLPVSIPSPEEGRTRAFLRFPLVVSNIALQPGKIIAQILADGEEINISSPWVVLPPNTQSSQIS